LRIKPISIFLFLRGPLSILMTEAYDIVIIGAGPAGASAARAAALRGRNVLLIDRRQRVGVPVQCAEFVPQWVSRYAHFSSKCILQTIDLMVTRLPDGTSYEMKSPGYMLDRSLFDKELVASAILSGGKISIETRAVNLSPQGLVVERGLKTEVIQSKVFIGADGVHSSIARCVGQPPLKTIVGLQYEVVMPEPQNHVDVFFHKDYEGGYAWFFPKGRTANAGVGVIPQKTTLLLRLMDHFLDHLVGSKRLSSIEIVAKTGGSIPCEKSRKTVFENILLAGDAAGHAHPITGAGIFNAVMGGEIAGRIAAESVEKGDLRYLGNYEIEWQEAFGKSLSYGGLKREFLEKNWNKPEVDFGGLIRKTWVGFKEYCEDRRKIPLHSPEAVKKFGEAGGQEYL
jgi:geranylgeranyl reductase family protein